MICRQPGCRGHVVDGYCDVCGMAPPRAAAPASNVTQPPAAAAAPASSASRPPAPPFSAVQLPGRTSAATAASPPSVPRATTGPTRSGSRHRLGAGLVEVPPVPFRDPADAVMVNPTVPENRRFCGRCDEPVGRSRDGVPGRPAGFCRKCGAPFSFEPKLGPGTLVAGQYEVVGCLAHGGMGWVYLARDRNVSDRWVVLKGLLNAGDSDATAAALAERRFLAEVEHPNIVKIFNFVEHEASGYIVMEYVGGQSLKQILAARREANGGEPDPLPPAQSIAYMLEILPALGYLHDSGLLFCDFKLDNVIQTQHSLKLIDLGGVYRIDEPSSAVFGTVGYQAPEIATRGPSVASDLFTVARTLAVLCLDFRGYQSTYRYTLPPEDSVALWQRYDALYRFLVKATAPEPEARFQSVSEMAEQLSGVLREVVADEVGRPVPAASTLFTSPLRAGVERPDWHSLPRPQVVGDDPSAGYLGTIAATSPQQQVAQLRAVPQQTVEVRLRLAAALTESGELDGADAILDTVQASDPAEWRVRWYRGVAALARGQSQPARASFEAVYRELPGELAPKLAVAVALESGGQAAAAARWYEIVARTDPSVTGASFGLARCRLALGDRAGAITAYMRVPDSSSGYLDAQTARIRLLSAGDGADPSPDELLDAASQLGGLPVDEHTRAQLTACLLGAALRLTRDGRSVGDERARLLGRRLTERDLRVGLESAYRALARHATTRAERIRLVDEANRTRPRTWI